MELQGGRELLYCTCGVGWGNTVVIVVLLDGRHATWKCSLFKYHPAADRSILFIVVADLSQLKHVNLISKWDRLVSAKRARELFITSA